MKHTIFDCAEKSYLEFISVSTINKLKQNCKGEKNEQALECAVVPCQII